METELRNQFDEMNVEPTEEVIAKAMELCTLHNMNDAAEFVEKWLAFSLSHLNGAEPTVENLQEFDRKVLQLKRDKELSGSSMKKKGKYPLAIANMSHLVTGADEMDVNPLAMYGVTGGAPIGDSETGAEIGTNDENMLDTYACHTPKPKARSALYTTPARHSDALLFSPAGYSPLTGTSTPRIHKAAPGSGKTVYTFGNPTLISTTQWTSLQQPKIHVKQLLLHNGEALSAAKAKYMFDNLHEKSKITVDRAFRLGLGFCQKLFGVEAQTFMLDKVHEHSQEMVKNIGIVLCEHDGPLDASSALLVGLDEDQCRTVRLNFKRAKTAGVFPGQVVIVSGMNPTGDLLTVDEIHAERALIPPASPTLGEQLSFVVAAGPYTHSDDLVYEPLHDLIAYLKEHKPDVLVLTGPFLEADHKLISANTTLAEPFEMFFEKIIAGIVDAIGTVTTILVVASHQDANADAVYPTMPFTLKKNYPNVHLLPDPSMVDLNGIVIGTTSTDIVDHLIQQELAINAGDKAKRVVQYLLNQGSFYPLHPPHVDDMCFDSVLAEKYANIEQLPNILILPSSQKCFIRVVNGCLAINPGRLTGENGGTFARFVITPPSPKDDTSLFNYVGCQVRKI